MSAALGGDSRCVGWAALGPASARHAGKARSRGERGGTLSARMSTARLNGWGRTAYLTTRWTAPGSSAHSSAHLTRGRVQLRTTLEHSLQGMHNLLLSVNYLGVQSGPRDVSKHRRQSCSAGKMADPHVFGAIIYEPFRRSFFLQSSNSFLGAGTSTERPETWRLGDLAKSPSHPKINLKSRSCRSKKYSEIDPSSS